MKKILLIGAILIGAAIFVAQTSSTSNKGNINNSVSDTLAVLQPEKYYSTVDEWISTILSRYHYNKVSLNDSLSSVILDRFIKTLDYNKMYFLQSDIDEFEKYRFKLDDDIKEWRCAAGL